MPDASRELPDVIAGNYQIEREVGRGGMAVVYRAHDARHDRAVALKVLNADVAASLGKERFLLEIRIAARLNHPHIVALHDSGEFAGIVYYVMPFIEGPTLRDYMRQHQRIPLDESLRFAGQIATALDYAHRLGLVHRDIKPENVMIHEGMALVTDFGIAKALSSASNTTLTQAGVALGTPAYMSPEQAAGETELDGRSDLYSFACVVYEMVTGQPPFSADSVPALIAKRFTSKPVSIKAFAPAVPDGVATAISRALAVEPKNRFSTVSEFAASLATRSRDSDADEAKRSIAVLPFVNLSADAENEFFSDGITEEIINSLSKVQALEVVSRRSAFAWKGKDADMRAIGTELNVGHLLSGTVRRAGNHLRISAELVDVETGFHRWSERFDREMADVFAIQDEIAGNIVNALALVLTDRELVALKVPRSTSVRAYDYYLKGRQLFKQFKESTYETAADCFRRAICLDPGYTPAYAGLAEVSAFKDLYFRASPESVEQADAASRKAVELSPQMGHAHAARGLALACLRKHAEAEAELLTAMELDATLFEAPYYYGRLLTTLGRLEEAARHFEMAATLNPDDYQALVLAVGAYRGVQRYDDATRVARTAVAAARRAVEADPEDARALYLGIGALQQLGEESTAAEWAVRSEELNPDDQGTLYNLACYYSVAGRKDKALTLLERAADRGWDRPDWLEHDSDLDGIRDEPRYGRLVEGMKKRAGAQPK